MPHNYRSLRNHIASVHPNIQKDFEAGWKRLGPRLQKKWEQVGIYDPGSQRDIIPDRFESWTRVLDSELRIESPLLSQLQNDFSDWLTNIQENEGSFLKVPELSGFLSRLPIILRTPYNVGKVAATTMLSRELEKTIERLKGEIEENGLDFIRQYFPDLFPPEEMKEIDEYMAGRN